MLSIYDIYDILPFLGCVLKWLPASTYYWLVGKNTGPTRAIKLGWNIHLRLGGSIWVPTKFTELLPLLDRILEARTTLLQIDPMLVGPSSASASTWKWLIVFLGVGKPSYLI